MTSDAPASAPADAAAPIESAWRRVLFEDNFQPAWIYDPKTLSFLDVNVAALERYGYSREQFLAMTIKDIRPAEDIPALLDRIANFDGGRYISGEWRHLRVDGAMIYAEVASYPIDFEGRPARLNVIHDVTERHLAEETLKRTIQDYRGLFENAHDAILIVSAEDARVLDANERACELFGYSRSEFLGLSLLTISKDPQSCGEHMSRVLSRGSAYHFDAVKFRKDGSELYLEINASVVTYKGQQAVLGINRDVTQRRRSEEAMRQEEQRRRLHVKQTPLGVIEWDTDFKVVAWNPAAERIFGYTATEAVGRTGPDLILDDAAKPHVAEIWSALLAARGGLRSTNPNVTKDGKKIFCEWYNTPLIDSNGQVVGVASLVQDVSDSVVTRQALEDSENRYRTLADTVPAIVFSTDVRTGTDYYNQRWYVYTGMTVEQSKGQGWGRAVHPDDLAALMAEWKRCEAAGEPCQYEFRLRRHDGAYRWFLVRLVPLRDESGNIHRWLGTSTDVDDLKQTKEILQKIFDHIPVMISFVSGGRYVLANRAWETTLGYSAHEACSRDVLPEMYPDPGELHRVRDFIARADGTTWGNFPTLSRDGRLVQTRWINFRVEGGPIIGFGLDVTQQQRDELELRQTAERLQQIAHNIEEIFWIMDADRKILYINQAYERIWQQSVQSLMDDPSTWMNAVHPEDRAIAWSDDPLTWDREFRLLRSDGGIRWVHSRAMPIRDADGRAYRGVGICQDITERKEAEAALQRHLAELEETLRKNAAQIRELERQRAETDKLIATARVAANIAHEINNPLGGIDIAFSLIKDSIPKEDLYFPHVARIEKELDRLKRITRQTFDVYKTQTEQPTQFKLDDALADVASSLAPVAKALNVAVKILPCGCDSAVFLPEQAVRQILLNVVRNAMEASPQGQSVDVKCFVGAPDVLLVSVIDRGSGIAEENKSFIFDPFFTTKGKMPSAGLGLGLSIANSMAVAMGGKIEFDTQPGRGTTFTITLPRQHRPVAAIRGSSPHDGSGKH